MLRYIAGLAALLLVLAFAACPDTDDNQNNNNNQGPDPCEVLETAETLAASAVCTEDASCLFCDCALDGLVLEVIGDGTDLSFECVPAVCDASAAQDCMDATDLCVPNLTADASALCELSTADASDSSPL